MNQTKQLHSASKFLSLVLRHAPETIGLTLDTAGWASVADLLARMAAHATPLTLEQLHELVASSDKQRFALSPDGSRIRANQGHSLAAVDLGLAPAVPPALLYHGTASRFIDAIRADGLRPQTRQHVHLSTSEATALAVGTRHGRPVILRIAAAALHASGQPFHLSDNGVWLTAQVPVAYIGFPEQE